MKSILLRLSLWTIMVLYTNSGSDLWSTCETVCTFRVWVWKLLHSGESGDKTCNIYYNQMHSLVCIQ